MTYSHKLHMVLTEKKGDCRFWQEVYWITVFLVSFPFSVNQINADFWLWLQSNCNALPGRLTSLIFHILFSRSLCSLLLSLLSSCSTLISKSYLNFFCKLTKNFRKWPYNILDMRIVFSKKLWLIMIRQINFFKTTTVLCFSAVVKK